MIKHTHILVAAALAMFMTVANAQVNSTGTATGPNGKSATRNSSRSAGSAQSSTTGPNGKTTSRSVARGKGSATATATGPNGKSATRTRTTTKQ